MIKIYKKKALKYKRKKKYKLHEEEHLNGC